MAEITMVEAIRSTLEAEMERDEKIVVFGEDVGESGGVFRATDGLQARFGGQRVFDTPLAESAIVAAAVGMAVSGLVPVIELQFMGFAHNAFNQIVEQLARLRYRSWGSLSAPVTLRMPCGGGVRAPEMHSDSFEAHFAHAPGLKMVAPSNPADARGLLAAAIRDPDPVMVLEPLRGYRLVRGEVPDGEHVVPLGEARVVREGADCTVVAWSVAVHAALAAAEAASAEGVSAEVIDLRTLVPLDVETLCESVSKTGRLVVAHEASRTGGFGAEVIASIQENEDVFFGLHGPAVRVCGPDSPYPVQMIEPEFLLGEAEILAGIQQAMRS